MTLPNSFHVLPSNFSNCICLTGAKSVALVEIVIPGRSMDSARLWRFAASFMTFWRVRLSPQAFSTKARVCAYE